MEKMYEVLRFVEKGTECQPSIDCLQGELLIYYLRDNTQLDKAVLFEWFRQIAGEIRKYQQSRRGQNYRCLTPYSIVVTEEGELLLLNPDAQENEFVMKKMQQKAVRSHFIRPTASGSRKNCSVDLFGYGKILQFFSASSRAALFIPIGLWYPVKKYNRGMQTVKFSGSEVFP